MGKLTVSKQIYKKINAPYLGERMNVFISYSSKDSVLAGTLKKNLGKYGVSTFLAHEDIKPGLDWAEELVKKLETCSVVLPIISKDFIDSEWTSQEIGYAYAKKRFILALKIDKDVNPKGFIAGSQALKLNPDNLENSGEEVVNVLRRYRALREQLVNSLIYSLELVPDYSGYETANSILVVLKKVTNLTETQLNQIVKIALKNHQVRECSEGQKYLKSIVRNKKAIIDSDLQEIYQQLKNTYDLPVVSKDD